MVSVPKRTIYFSFGADEEVGGIRGAKALVHHLSKQNVRLEWSLDEGSYLTRGISLPEDKLVASINVAEKGFLNLKITSKSKGGHSSVPPPVTAVDRLAKALIKLRSHPLPATLEGSSWDYFEPLSRNMSFTKKLFFANRWLFDGLLVSQMSESRLANAVLRTTIAPTQLYGSPRSNVLPIEASAIVNFRIHPRDTIESTTNHVKKLVEDEYIEVTVSGFNTEASPVSKISAPGFQIIKTAVNQIYGAKYGEIVFTPGVTLGATDARYYNLISNDTYRFNPSILTRELASGFHGTNEKINKEDYLLGIKTYIQIIKAGAY